jgi:hypothetical protein
MKDSRIGTYGTVALWFTLTAKFLLLQELLRHAGGALFLCILASAPTLGRGATVLLLQALPYVSGAESKSRRFAERLTPRQIVFALLLPVAIVVVLPRPYGPSFLIAGALVTVCAGRWFRNKIGGITGDCLGATNQLVELACYAAAVVHLLHPFSGSLSLTPSMPVFAAEGQLILARHFNTCRELSVPEGRPILARDFSPWKALERACVPSGRLKGAPRSVPTPKRFPPVDPASPGTPIQASRWDAGQGNGFQGLKSLAKIGRPSGTKATHRRSTNLQAGVRA